MLNERKAHNSEDLAPLHEDLHFDIPSLIKEHSGDMASVASHLIAKMSEMNSPEEKVFLSFSNALRNLPEHDVRILQRFINTMENVSPTLNQGVERALKNFERWGCQIARYQRGDQKSDLSARYTSNKNINLLNEMHYGEQCFKDAEEALRLCTNPAILPKQDGPLAFLNTEEKSKHGLQVAIEFLMQRHYENSIERGGNTETSEDMRTRQTDTGFSSPILAYDWATPLVKKIYELSKTNTIEDLKECDFGDSGRYRLIYDNRILTEVWVDNSPDYLNMDCGPCWNHGINVNNIKELWPRLEELHDEVMNFPLSKDNPPNNTYENLVKFYDKVVETIWLLGNLTPANRGTGKLVEQWLTMAHLQHHLRTPILNLENPQIDVLDITLPLSLYKKRFLGFFEIDSLPKPVAEHVMSQKMTTTIAASGGSPVYNAATNSKNNQAQLVSNTLVQVKLTLS